MTVRTIQNGIVRTFTAERKVEFEILASQHILVWTWPNRRLDENGNKVLPGLDDLEIAPFHCETIG